ncbi:hypothetical protein BGY98DRAFT_945414 [Russula aff. rugulosa BPL654]|nr:hypothetical protein BGY98DRAFT_945414 [Russula aff. rugulosa BPL654]
MTIFESFKKRFAISERITDFILRSGLCSCMGFSYFPLRVSLAAPAPMAVLLPLPVQSKRLLHTELNHIDELENDISDIMYSKFLSTYIIAELFSGNLFLPIHTAFFF